VRLIRSGPLPPALNLALDEALLRAGEETLRLYAWNPPAMSLGFFQKAAEFEDCGLPLVRRPTGGGAIAHSGELTLAWIGRRVRVDVAYATINAIVTDAVRSLGIDVVHGTDEPEAAPTGLCFDAHTCYDLMAGGGKFFGSAQRRGGDRFLLHGTLVLAPNRWARGSVSLSELSKRPIGRPEMEQSLVAAARRAWQVEFRSGAPTAEEWQHADRLVSERYGAKNWTYRR